VALRVEDVVALVGKVVFVIQQVEVLHTQVDPESAKERMRSVCADRSICTLSVSLMKKLSI
jgi:hypothetical protein